MELCKDLNGSAFEYLTELLLACYRHLFMLRCASNRPCPLIGNSGATRNPRKWELHWCLRKGSITPVNCLADLSVHARVPVPIIELVMQVEGCGQVRHKPR